MSTIEIQLPNEEVFKFYEGADENEFTDLTGLNLNRAAVQLLANIKLMRDLVSSVVSGAPVYNPATNYSKGQIVKRNEGSGEIFASTFNGNTNNSLNNTDYWIPVTYNIDDNIIGPNTTWSSSKVVSYADSKAEDEGILNAIVFSG